jgi:hypothetical protein
MTTLLGCTLNNNSTLLSGRNTRIAPLWLVFGYRTTETDVIARAKAPTLAIVRSHSCVDGV